MGWGILTGMQVMPKQLHQQKVSAQNEYQLLHSCAYRVLPRLHLHPPPPLSIHPSTFEITRLLAGRTELHSADEQVQQGMAGFSGDNPMTLIIPSVRGRQQSLGWFLRVSCKSTVTAALLRMIVTCMSRGQRSTAMR